MASKADGPFLYHRVPRGIRAICNVFHGLNLAAAGIAGGASLRLHAVRSDRRGRTEFNTRG
jgi:hypothetical protein